MTEEEELSVIRRVIDGEIEVFERLVLHYQVRLMHLIASLLDDRCRFAEDVTQTVFVEAFRRLATFDPSRSRFSTWLFMIARSRAIHVLQKKRPLLLAELPERSADPPDPGSRETFEALDRALQSLPAKQRRAFSLVALEELSYGDAARIEGTTVGTIKSRVSRAREFLKSSLTQT